MTRVAQFHTWLTWLLLYLSNNFGECNQVTRSRRLSPSNSSIDGASITISQNSNVNIQNDAWNIDVTTQKKFDLHLKLDDTLAFINGSNNISLDIYGNTTLPTANWLDLDLLVAFSVDGNEYISVAIRLDNIQRNMIYPRCATDPSLPAATAVGAINQSMASTQDRWRTAIVTTSNSNTDAWMQPPYQDKINGWPLTFELFNDPISNRLQFSFTNDGWKQTCHFHSFTTNRGLDIFMALEDNTEQISLTEMDITSVYNQDIIGMKLHPFNCMGL